MECKFRKTGSYQKQLSELIDTLWNVNDSIRIIKGLSRYRINRYIMECKLSLEQFELR